MVSTNNAERATRRSPPDAEQLLLYCSGILGWIFLRRNTSGFFLGRCARSTTVPSARRLRGLGTDLL